MKTRGTRAVATPPEDLLPTAIGMAMEQQAAAHPNTVAPILAQTLATTGPPSAEDPPPSRRGHTLTGMVSYSFLVHPN